MLDDDEVLRPRGRPQQNSTGRADDDAVGIHARDIRQARSREDLQIPPVVASSPATSPGAARLGIPASPYPPGRSPSPNSAAAAAGPGGAPRILPRIPSPPSTSPGISQSRSGPNAGVSSLVQMYRDKEAASLATIPPALLPTSVASSPSPSPSSRPLPPQAQSPPAPSRLPIAVNTPHPPGSSTGPGSTSPGGARPLPPVRGASLPQSPQPSSGKEEAYPAAPVQRPSPSGIPISVQPQSHTSLPGGGASTPGDRSSVSSESSGMEPLEPPPVPAILLEPQRVPSPGRYIHGAPLTNVLEAEEEED